MEQSRRGSIDMENTRKFIAAINSYLVQLRNAH
ncbi:MAG: hypothetical protein QT03_C0001G0144 [archaeon GW2011_AR10]|nr:MAG: hypothetical protein QT03_C0001G0144 [archaeon GW2011_AR10]